MVYMKRICLIPSQFATWWVKEVHEAYTADEISTNVHIYSGIWPVFITARIQPFLIKNLLQKAHNLVTWVFQRLDKEKLEL